jgi:hypothetical protein
MPGVPACSWGNFGDCVVHTAENSIAISTSASGKVSGTFNIPTSQAVNRLSDDCPAATISSTATNYQYVEVRNPTATAAHVSVWLSKASTASAQDIDTVMAAYNGGALPATDAQRKACIAGVNDDCNDSSDPSACLAHWSGLVATNGAVTIAPSGSVLVYVAAFWGTSSSDAHAGDFVLNVRTDSLQ